MTHEDLERAIAFVLEQQARFEGQLAVTAQRQAEMAAVLTQTQQGMGLMAEAQVATLGLVQRLTQTVEQLTERVDTIAEKLDAFIVVVEKYITRNGGSPPR